MQYYMQCQSLSPLANMERIRQVNFERDIQPRQKSTSNCHCQTLSFLIYLTLRHKMVSWPDSGQSFSYGWDTFHKGDGNVASQGVGRHGPVLLKSYDSPRETCKCGFRHFCVGALEERESETNSEHSRKSSGNSSTLVETQNTVWEINTPKTKTIHTQWFKKKLKYMQLVCSFSKIMHDGVCISDSNLECSALLHKGNKKRWLVKDPKLWRLQKIRRK